MGLGSNLPIPEKNIIEAIENLRRSGFKILKYSSFYISEPAGYRDQPVFVNLALLLETELKPLKLLKKIKKIEKEMGRIKTFKNGPRKIDIDILLSQEAFYKDKKLKIPHKNFLKRPFEFLPSLEISPDFVHPLLKKSLKEIGKDLSFKFKVVKSVKPDITLAY